MNALWFQQVQVDVWYAKTGLRHFIPADSFSLVDSVSDDILSSAAGEYFFDAAAFLLLPALLTWLSTPSAPVPSIPFLIPDFFFQIWFFLFVCASCPSTDRCLQPLQLEPMRLETICKANLSSLNELLGH